MTAVATTLILAGLIILVLGLIRPKLFHWFGLTPRRLSLAAAGVVVLCAGVIVIPIQKPEQKPVVEVEDGTPRPSRAQSSSGYDDAIAPSAAKPFFTLTVQQVANALAERRSGLARADGKPDLREFTQNLANDGSSVLTTKRGDLEASFDASGRLSELLLISRQIEGEKLPWGIVGPMSADLAIVAPAWSAAKDWVSENQGAVWAGTEANASHSGVSITFRRLSTSQLALFIKPDTGDAPPSAPVTMAERVENFTDLATYCRFTREDTEITERAAREIGPNAAYGIAGGEAITLEQPVALKPTTRPGVEHPEIVATWKQRSYQLPAGSRIEIIERTQDDGDLHYLVRTSDGVLGFVDPAAMLWLEQKADRRTAHTAKLAAFRDPLKADLQRRFKEEIGLDFLAVELAKGMGAGWDAKCADQ